MLFLNGVGIVAGVTAEDVKSHTHEIGVVFGCSLAIEFAVLTTGIAIAAQASREQDRI